MRVLPFDRCHRQDLKIGWDYTAHTVNSYARPTLPRKSVRRFVFILISVAFWVPPLSDPRVQYHRILSSIKSIHNPGPSCSMAALGIGGIPGSGIARRIILFALYPLIITEVHSILWYYLGRSGGRRPDCLPWNSREENVFSLVISSCLPVLSPPLVKHWIV